MTPAQEKALLALRAGDFVRPRFGWDWITSTGGHVPLVTVSNLRKLGFAKIRKGTARMTASITEAGKVAAEGVVDA